MKQGSTKFIEEYRRDFCDLGVEMISWIRYEKQYPYSKWLINLPALKLRISAYHMTSCCRWKGEAIG